MAMVVAVAAFSVLFFGIGKGSAIAGPFMVISIDGDKVTLPGSQISYDIEYENEGDADALNVEIIDKIPADTTFDSASAGCTEAAGVVTCDIGAVGPGVGGSITITVLVDADVTVGTSLANSTSLNYSDGTKSLTVDSDDFITTVTGMEMKVYGQNFVEPGEDMAYVVLYRNISDETTIAEDCIDVTVTADYSSSIVEVSDTWGPQNVNAGNNGYFNFSVTVSTDAPVGSQLTSTFTMTYTHSGGVVAQAIKEVKTRVYESYLTDLVSPVDIYVQQASFSPDGKKIVFYSWDLPVNNADIFTINTDGSGPTQLTTDYGCDTQPDLSADGKKIVFRTNRNYGTHPDEPSNNSDIYIMDADGSNKVRLTDDPGCQRAPAISPDGTKVAYKDDMQSPDHGGGADGDRLWVVDSDGLSDPEMLPPDDYICIPGGLKRQFSWSPDSQWILFQKGSGDESYKVKADGSDIVQLTFNSEHIYSPRWSPDGSMISYKVGGCWGDPWNLVVMDQDGYNQRILVSDDYEDVLEATAWSPNSRWITYVQEISGGSGEIWIIDRQGRFTGMLTSLHHDCKCKWSPVGNRILVDDYNSVRNGYPFFINLDVSDPDSDGLANWEEDIVGSLINDPDTDGDGVKDGAEFDQGTNPLVAEGVAPSSPAAPEEEDDGCGCMVVGADSAPDYGKIASMAFIYLIPGLVIILRIRKLHRKNRA